MVELYYLTPTRNVPSILRQGLIAGRRRGLTEYLYREPIDNLMRYEKSSLYFAEDLESIGELASILSNLVRAPRQFSVLEVSLPEGSVVEVDESQFGGGAGSLGGFLRSNVTRVSPSRIKALGTITVRPKKRATYTLKTPAAEAITLGEETSDVAAQFEGSKEYDFSEEETQALEERIKQLPPTSRAFKRIRELKRN